MMERDMKSTESDFWGGGLQINLLYVLKTQLFALCLLFLSFLRVRLLVQDMTGAARRLEALLNERFPEP